LEEEAEKEHRALGKLILENASLPARQGFNDIFLCGKLIKAAQEEFPPAKHFYTKEDLIAHLKDNPIQHATVLVKASRGIGLETVVDVL
jgi:UDP-N-acetylmuramoyl-tripeptide--D-alanyl-D-alanine ligase